jgi:transposase
MDLTLRFRAYPDEETASEAWRHIEIHRQIRNHAVRDYYRSPRNDRPTAYDQHLKLNEWKRRWPTFAEVSAHAAQQTVSQIQKNQKVLKEHRKNGRKTGRLKWQGAVRVQVGSVPVRRLQRQIHDGPRLWHAHPLENRRNTDTSTPRLARHGERQTDRSQEGTDGRLVRLLRGRS